MVAAWYDRPPLSVIPTLLLTVHSGSASEIMSETEGAIAAYERALSFNPNSVPAMIAISCILRTKDQFPAAVEYLRQILRLEHNNGEVWSSLGAYMSQLLTHKAATADHLKQVTATS